jgi:hypothetical protein
MKKLSLAVLLLSLAVLLLATLPAGAQPQLRLGGGAGLWPGSLGGGPGVAGTVSVRWQRLLVDLHAVELTFITTSAFADPSSPTFAVGLDAGYVHPVAPQLGVLVGAGGRLHWDDGNPPGDPDRGFDYGLPYVQAGIVYGARDDLQVTFRNGMTVRSPLGEGVSVGLRHVLVGVSVPLTR